MKIKIEKSHRKFGCNTYRAEILLPYFFLNPIVIHRLTELFRSYLGYTPYASQSCSHFSLIPKEFFQPQTEPYLVKAISQFCYNAIYAFLKITMLYKVMQENRKTNGENEVIGTTLKTFVSHTLKQNNKNLIKKQYHRSKICGENS